MEEPMAFGQFAVYYGDTVPHKAKRPTLESDLQTKAMGFLELDPGKEPSDVAPFGYKVGDMSNVLQSGHIWVNSETAVSNTDPVYVRFVTALAGDLADTDLGNVRNDADGGDAAILPGAGFVETGSAGLALIRYNLVPASGAGATGPTGPTGPA
jgi:hypothetical protein